MLLLHRSCQCEPACGACSALEVMFRPLMLQAKLKAKGKAKGMLTRPDSTIASSGSDIFVTAPEINKRHRQCICECKCYSDTLTCDLVFYRSDRCMGNNSSTPVTPQTIYKAASANNVQLLIVSFTACKAARCAFVCCLQAKLLTELSYGACIHG